ncbi:MAG: hypothetical protein JWQ69_5419 [Pseudomonas sp.]|nr:hypothetical protein [Pseudomonas sp.]
MKPLNVKPCLAVLLLLGSASAFGQECKGLLALQAQLAANTENVDCGSLTSVMDSVVNGKRTLGRKLEEDKPYDPAAAQANLVKAQADPDVRQRLDKIRKDVPDGPTRWAYEAATFDENGYYGARDLRVHQLQQQLK